LLVLTGIALGVAAAGRYSEETALFVALLYVIPGVFFLAHWAGKQPIWLQAGLALAVVILMLLGGLQAAARHDRAFGPAHPQSALTEKPYDLVEWAWSGGVDATAATVNAKITGEKATRARLVMSTDTSFTSPVFSPDAEVTDRQGDVVSLRIQDLRPATTYYYAVEVDGVRDTHRTGSLETFPEGAGTFSIVVSSCARTGSNGLVFEAMLAEEPLLYIVPGDFHYQNIITDDPGAFRKAYTSQLTAPAQAALYQRTPVAYVWDDHDFGGSNSNGKSAASEAARTTYRENVPHYELPAGPGDAPIYQAFSVGRVRFVMTDTRSMRDLEEMPDGSDSLLGAEQREWLKRELLDGSRNFDLVVWVNSVPWIAPASGGRDDWGGYAAERAEIADFIADNGITNLMMLSGDAHMLAIDDGTNTNYSAGDGAGFPLMQAAALDRPGSVKGGPYSEGTFPGPGQYALVAFQYRGDSLVVRMSGRNWLREELVAYEFTVARPAAVLP
jgi:phosphodiesterase/alkaline phosphatase D-like protein